MKILLALSVILVSIQGVGAPIDSCYFAAAPEKETIQVLLKKAKNFGANLTVSRELTEDNAYLFSDSDLPYEALIMFCDTSRINLRDMDIFNGEEVETVEFMSLGGSTCLTAARYFKVDPKQVTCP